MLYNQMRYHFDTLWTILTIVAVPLSAVAGLDEREIVQSGVIPDWYRIQSAPVVREESSGICQPVFRPSASSSAACPSVLEFSVTQPDAAIGFDSLSKLTELYIGDFGRYAVLRHSVDSVLGHSSSVLPVPYGVVWEWADLDCDGNFELVLQRGDGSNGFLDIVSSPSWTLRKRFTYPGMNVYMHARAVNIDNDPYLELYLVPHSLSGYGRTVLIKYSAESADYTEIANIESPWYTQGEPAIGDFDNDSRIEFISGNNDGYGVFEWRDGQMNYTGNIGEPYGGYSAVECKPKPDGVLRALIGYGDDIGRYQLFRPVGDNEFELEHVFLRPTGYSGVHPCQAADVDCDGMDELAMLFPPGTESWEWDVIADSFVQSCTWENGHVSTSAWYPVDLDQNGAPEWGNIDSELQFHDFPGPECVGCDPTGHCIPPSFPCVCACHADPSCDGVLDVVDVVKSIDVAFRNNPEQNDPAPLCDAMQTDVNCDRATDIVDVVKVINVAFRNAAASAEFCDPCNPLGPQQ